jgi:tetratricopeptide (TPR) repeat protein
VSLYGALTTIRLAGLEAESDKVAYQMATSGSFAQIDPEVQSGLANRALSYAARTGELSQVDDLLRYVRVPYQFIALLSLREYESIWPNVERYAGDHLASVTNSYVSWTSARLADKPEDLDRLSDYAYAMLFAGRYDEAATLADTWLARPGRNGVYEEGDGWALNMEAYALSALGRTAEADKVFDDLAKLSPDEHPWVVNFVINRTARLVSQGRWAEGLAASEAARSVSEKYGSGYAKLLVASERACAFDRLGRKDESGSEFKYVIANFADAPESAVQALLCAGRDDEAADLFRRILNDDKIRSQLLDGLQDDRFDLFWAGPSKIRNPYDLMMARPDLKKEASNYVRAIPERFVPLAYLRRQQISAPSAKHGPGGVGQSGTS